MANDIPVKVTPVKDIPFLSRLITGLKGFREAFSGDNYLGPSEPIAPRVQMGEPPRQFQYQPGYNIALSTRSTELTPFELLRAVADNLDVLRIVIEKRKAMLKGLEWDIVPTEKEMLSDMQAEITLVKKFLERPDKDNYFDEWLNMILEDVYVVDAMSIYKRRTKGGKLYSLEPIDGSSIKPIIDTRGRQPDAPLPAYQQILYGQVNYSMTKDELIYRPKNKRTKSIYGFPPTEYLLLTVNRALRRQTFDLSYYTAGNMPESFGVLPSEFKSSKQIKEFQDYWDALIAGDQTKVRRMKFVPNGFQFIPIKDRNEGGTSSERISTFEEMIVRTICAAFDVTPHAFVKMMNRATAQVEEDESADTGLDPDKQFIKRLMDDIIQKDLNQPDLQFIWVKGKDKENELSIRKNESYIRNGVLSIDEVRQMEGREPLGVPHFVMTATGPVFLKDLVAGREESMTPQNGGEDRVMKPGKPEGEKPEGEKPEGEKPEGEKPEGEKPEGEKPEEPEGEDEEGEGREGEGKEDKAKDMKQDIARWQKVAYKALKDGRKPRPFMSSAIPEPIRKMIEDGLTDLPTAKQVFAKAKRVRMTKTSKGPLRKEQAKLEALFLKGLKKTKQRIMDYVLKNVKLGKALMDNFNFDEFDDEFFNELNGQLESIINLGSKDARKTLQSKRTGPAPDPALEYAREQAANLIGTGTDPDYAITSIIRDRVNKTVSQAIREQWTQDELATALEEMAGFGSARAEMIAITETANAYNVGTVTEYAEMGVEKFLVLDGDGDEECAEANGQEWTLEETLENPIGHPNCFLGETPVFSPMSDIATGYARHYAGEVIEFRTGRGRNFTVTPNHPILTLNGWVPACLLKPGDNVLGIDRESRVAFFGNNAKNNQEAPIQDIVGSVLLGGSQLHRMSATDFHGDSSDSDVCVIGTNRLFKNRIISGQGTKKTKMLCRNIATDLSFPTRSTPTKIGHASSLATNRIVGRIGKPGTANPSQHIDINPATKRNAMLFKPGTDTPVADTIGLGDESGRIAPFVTVDNILHIKRSKFVGQVFNLETRQNWYLADSIITHNCVRAFAPIASEDIF